MAVALYLFILFFTNLTFETLFADSYQQSLRALFTCACTSAGILLHARTSTSHYCLGISMSKTTGKKGSTQAALGSESDEFRMFVFKIKECSRVGAHDWIQCPYAHPGEKVRRRDPIRQPYAAVFCADYRLGGGRCPRGDACGLAHGLFEYWLHPARYRTRACMAGGSCPRKVCFFAHSPEQLRSGQGEGPPPAQEYKLEALPVREFRSEEVVKMGDEEDLDWDSPDISWVLELLG